MSVSADWFVVFGIAILEPFVNYWEVKVLGASVLYLFVGEGSIWCPFSQPRLQMIHHQTKNVESERGRQWEEGWLIEA